MYTKVLSVISLILLLTGCAQQSSVPAPVPEQTPSSTAAVSGEGGDEVDTSDWKTYTSEEFGFSFRYPDKLSVLKKETIDFNSEDYNSDYWSGKSFTILLSEDERVVFEVTGYTQDYNSFYFPGWFQGGIEDYCVDERGKHGLSRCFTVINSEQKWVVENLFYDHECSPLFSGRLIMENPNNLSNYKTVVFSYFPDETLDKIFAMYHSPLPCSGGVAFDKEIQALVNDINRVFFKESDKINFRILNKMVSSAFEMRR